MAGAARIIGVDLNPKRFHEGESKCRQDSNIVSQLPCFSKLTTPIYVDYSLLLTAEKFGVTEFVNPKDHEKSVQEVHTFSFFIIIWGQSNINKPVLYTDFENSLLIR